MNYESHRFLNSHEGAVSEIAPKCAPWTAPYVEYSGIKHDDTCIECVRARACLYVMSRVGFHAN